MESAEMIWSWATRGILLSRGMRWFILENQIHIRKQLWDSSRMKILELVECAMCQSERCAQKVHAIPYH
jgi:hypothetical protein